MQDADDLVERAAIRRVPRVRRVDDGGEAFLGRKVDRDRDDLGTRHHHLVRLLVGEVEDLVQELLLHLLHDAGLAGLGDDQADVLLRVGDDAGGRGLDSEEAREGIRRGLEEPHERGS